MKTAILYNEHTKDDEVYIDKRSRELLEIKPGNFVNIGGMRFFVRKMPLIMLHLSRGISPVCVVSEKAYATVKPKGFITDIEVLP